jgi:hypothetical protein
MQTILQQEFIYIQHYIPVNIKKPENLFSEIKERSYL